ncbi:hypothetical protein GCM10010517_14660 [Streptosporangium fragile]|uniref:Uncharacterized protein n=1 Tax=Streptosporangium fragile TaxID=46186 RepID=A0ABN3VTM9_9ACTN
MVNPPSIPIPKKGRRSGWACRVSVTSTISTPINRHPVMLIAKVAQGKPPGGCGKVTVSPWRASAPAVPPTEIAASVVHGTRRVPSRRRPARAAVPEPAGAARAKGPDGVAGPEDVAAVTGVDCAGGAAEVTGAIGAGGAAGAEDGGPAGLGPGVFGVSAMKLSYQDDRRIW